MQSKQSSPQDQWSSKWGFILAATGAAVGLGNIWRFPYMAGENGGSAFVIIYLACVLLIGIPIMMSEIVIGRAAQKNPVDAMRQLALANKGSKHWGLVGWWGALTLLLVLSFYSVVSGWSIAYLIRCASGQFHHLNPLQVTAVWANFLSHPWQLLIWHSVFMILTMGVITRGVQKGLEKAAKLMMPALYLILTLLVIYAAIQGNFKQAFDFLFGFRFDKVTPDIVVSAMGHAFFTLALGAGAMLTYGAYVPKKISITRSVFIIAGLDVLVAFLAGLAIFPLVFAYHLPLQSGPGLMFVSLPIAFAHLDGGAIIGSLFFILLLFAAWTSSINLAEPIVSILMRRLDIKRKRAAYLVGFTAWALGIVSILSFNLWKNVTIHKMTLFDMITGITNNFMLPIGGLCFALFVGWIMSKKTLQQEMPLKPIYFKSWLNLVKYFSPIAILTIFASLIN